MKIISGTVMAEDIDCNRRRLITPYCCIIDDTLYVVPKGYEWNGASLPRFAWSLHGHPYDDIHREPGLWHDAAHDGLFRRQGVTREYSNRVYAHWVHANGLGVVKSIVEYLAVKFFGESHWYANKNNKKENQMKDNMKIGAAFAAFVVAIIAAIVMTGCTVTKAEWGGQVPVLDADGNPIILTNGMAQVVNLPNRFYNNRHWMDTNIQTAKMDVQKDRYGVELNGYSSVVSTQFVAFAKVTADAVTDIAAKVVSACASQGVTIGLDAAKALVGKYLGSGGDPEKMSVECKDGSCTITDGEINCIDGSCTPN